ncbi:MAG: DUF4337 family protein [Candidatus Wallbacteria bacterium]|nr:DUF4337 family protein [Candidatus Wallbacteria bacterium]
MPEEIEVETEGLHEIIHEKKHEAEHAGQGQRTGWISGVAVTTAVVAAMAAIAALLAGDSVNQSLMLKSEASIKQTERSDQWSFYQAKDTRRFLAEAVVEILQSQPATPASAAGVVRYRSEAEHFKKEKEEIQRRANQLEKDAERLDEEAEKLHMAHERFAPAVTPSRAEASRARPARGGARVAVQQHLDLTSQQRE